MTEKFVIYSYLKNSKLIRSKSVNKVNSFNPRNYQKHTITNQVKRTTELEIKSLKIFLATKPLLCLTPPICSICSHVIFVHTRNKSRQQ